MKTFHFWSIRTPPCDRGVIELRVSNGTVHLAHGKSEAKMQEQMLQEGPDVEAREIAWATAKVESEPAPFGGDRQAAADREAIVPVPVEETRGLPFGGPGATDIGDEQKAALIDEDEVGAS